MVPLPDMATMIYGRDTLEKVYARYLPHRGLPGTSSDCLWNPCTGYCTCLETLRPGDELLAPVGKPYDTLEEVIGIRPSKGSLAEYGVSYRQVDLLAGRHL